MSDTMLLGILRMPPDCWSGDEFDVMQRHQRYLQAATRIESQEFLIYSIARMLAEGYEFINDKELLAAIKNELLIYFERE